MAGDDLGRDLRGALVGATVSGFFGAMWALWGASGLVGPWSWIARIVGVVAGVAVVVGSAVLVRRMPPADAPAGTMFSDFRYRIIVAGEVLAIVVGSLLLNGTGNGQYVCPWVAFVVGVHFLAFGRVFWTGFALLGGIMIAAAALGTVLGLTTGNRDAVVATTALISAAVLLGFGARTVATVAPRATSP